jgi:hypothetical protein
MDTDGLATHRFDTDNRCEGVDGIVVMDKTVVVTIPEGMETSIDEEEVAPLESLCDFIGSRSPKSLGDSAGRLEDVFSVPIDQDSSTRLAAGVGQTLNLNTGVADHLK